MFQAGVSSVDDQDIDLLMGVNPGAESLLEAQQAAALKAAEKKEATEKKDPNATAVQPQLNPEQEVDSLLGGEDTNTSTEVDELGNPIPKKEVKKPGPVAKAKLPDSTEVNYEAIYNDMVSQGLWEEVELPEGKTWDKATFAEVQKLQASSQYEDLLSRTGPVGKGIIEYEKNGGNPSEIINLYREQRDIQEYDISDVTGQEEFLRAYYEAQNYSEKSIERTISGLTPEDKIEEAKEKKALWDSQYLEEIEARKNEQALQHKQMQEAIKNFEKNITTTLTADADLLPKERKDIQSYMLNYNQNYQGRQVSQFYVDMAEIQKDPKNYVELAKFIKGLKNGEYVKKVTDKVKKEANVASYLKIKNGAALKLGDDRENSLQAPDKTSSFITLLNKK